MLISVKKKQDSKKYVQQGYSESTLQEEQKEIEGIIKRPLMPHEIIELKNSKLNIFNDKNDDLTITY